MASKLFIAIITGHSQRIKNLRKIGFHYDITEGQCTKSKPSHRKVVFYVFDVLMITPLLSWVYLCYLVFSIIKASINKVPIPEKIKEINYKLSSIDLPKESVKECMNEIAIFYGAEDASFDDRNPYEDEYDKNTYLISSGSEMHDWNVSLKIDKKGRKFMINARDPDFGEHITTYEYKFEGQELWSRSIELKHQHPDHTEFDIKNGVVMEQEYRDRQKNSLVSLSEDVDEKIKELYSEINWSKNHNPAIMYFILFRHGDLFDDMATKRFLQSEYERITYGFARLKKRVEELGCTIDKQEFISGNTIRCDNDDTSEEALGEIREILHGGGLANYNINYSEFNSYDHIVEDLKLYLSKL